MIKRYIIFTQLSCTKCPSVKAFLKENVSLPGQEIDATSDEGFAEARKQRIMQTPTLIFFDENDKEVARATSVEEIKKILGI
jgi:glutaredoxin